MNSNLFVLHVYFVLFFGFISCSPDKVKGPQANPQDAQGEIINSDSTYQKIKDTKELRIDSFISLNLNAVIIKDTSSVSHVSCRSSHLNRVTEQELITKATSELQVKNILPIEVFRPYSVTIPDIRCDFNLESFMNNKLISVTKLKNVKIINSHDFINLQLPFLNEKQTPFFKRKDLETQTLVFPTSEGENQTLCQKTTGFYYSQSNQAFFHDILIPEIFNDNIEHCRLIYRDQITQNIYLSSDFYIQDKNPEFDFVSFEHFIETEEINDLSQKILARIIYRNISSFKVYYQLRQLTTNLSFLPIYYAPLRGFEMGNAEVPISTSGLWHLVNPIPAASQDSLGDLTYEVMPNENIILELTSNQKLSCVTDLSNLKNSVQNNNSPCDINIILAGILFNIQKTPLIRMNGFSDLRALEFIDFNAFSQPQSLYNQFNFWAPFRDVKSLCHKRENIEIFNQTPVRMDIKNPQTFNCRVL